MEQRIIIRHFGPIDDLEMEVKKFNLLTGEQAAGKSTVAKSVYFLRRVKTAVSDRLARFYDYGAYIGADPGGKDLCGDLDLELRNIFTGIFGSGLDLDPQFFLSCVFAEGISVEVSPGHGGNCINIRYSEKLRDDIQKVKEEIMELRRRQAGKTVYSVALEAEEDRRGHKEIFDRVNRIFRDDKETYYIPAGRNILSVLSRNRSTLNSMLNLDLITDTFLEQTDLVRSVLSDGIRAAVRRYPEARSLFDTEKTAERIIRMEKGEYCCAGGQEYLVTDDRGTRIPVCYASSGQQALLWVLNFLYALMLRREKAFVIIEEPETGLYPSLQKEVAEFLCSYANITGGGILITTHSPYLLTAINNLYYAGVLAAETGETEKVREIVGDELRVGRGELTAVMLDPRGSGTVSLLEEDGRELQTDLIDDVSSQINRTYTALYDIELEHGED